MKKRRKDDLRPRTRRLVKKLFVRDIRSVYPNANLKPQDVRILKGNFHPFLGVRCICACWLPLENGSKFLALVHFFCQTGVGRPKRKSWYEFWQ